MEVHRQKASSADGSIDPRRPDAVQLHGDCCLHQLVEAQVQRTPQALAAVQGERSITYAALDRRANRLATTLAERGLDVQQMVGVCAERSLENLVAILAVLKAGAAYVPVDPTYPQNRIDSIVQNASTRVILAEPRFADRLSHCECEIIGVDADDDREFEHGPASGVTPNDLAYVIHTSGSSGRPKGVMVEHRSVVNLVRFYLDFHALAEGDRGTQIMRPGFDASVVEIWPMLAAGATICIPEERVYMDPARLLPWMAETGITFSDVPTALAEGIFEEPLPLGLRLRTLITGGDKLRRRPPAGFPIPVYDQYGPTETTVITTQGRVLPSDQTDEPLDIGRSIPNHRAYVLDNDLALVPDGEVGELVVAGAGVARGYLNLPEETARRFVADPHADEPGDRMYRTGDRVRRLPDGCLQYLGRIDEQVQLRGFRIEPSEVQDQLARHPDVREALVLPYSVDGEGASGLVAYWLAREGATASVASLRAFLGECLPHYMVPTRFVALKAWPLTGNGKVDRRALPAPPAAPGDREVRPPRNDLERKLVDIWSDVLACGPVGIDDDFFDLGGQSLLAARVFSRIERELDLDLPLALLFDAPTVAALADHVRGVAPVESGRGLIPLQTDGTQPPVFFLPGVGGHVLSFRELARALGPDQPSFGLQDPALDEEAEPFESIEQMAAHFVGLVRQTTEGPPYCLCGYSFGGTVALEMARQLRAAGETSVFLGLIDTPAPGYPAKLPFAERMAVHLGNFTGGSFEDRRHYFSQRLSNLRRRFSEEHDLYQGEVADVVTPRMRSVIAAHYRCHERYTFPKYPGRICLLRALEQPDWPGTSFDDPHMGWGKIARAGVAVHEVPGTHLEMLHADNRRVLARELTNALCDFQELDAASTSGEAAPLLEGIRIGFLSSVDPNDPESISGMPFAMKQQLLRLGAEVEDVVPHTGFLDDTIGRARQVLRGGARRVFGERWVPRTSRSNPAYDDPAKAYDAFLGDSLLRSRDVARQLQDKSFDLLFGCCVSTLLCDLEPQAPVVYFSDTTARLINETYPEYLSKPARYHDASEHVEREGLARATAAIFATRSARESAVSDYGVAPERAHTVPMGANLAPSRALQRKAPPSRYRLELVLTAVDPVRKRTDMAVEIVEQLVAAGCRTRLTLIGVSTPRARASKHVRCAGFLRMSRPADLARHREILRRAHLMLLPSSGEAFGIATVEAALEGVPSVVSDVGGLPEAVVHGETGIVIPNTASAGDYVQAILNLVDDAAGYAAMSEAAELRARTEHTWDHWGKRVGRLIRDLVANEHADYRRSG